MPPRPVLLWVRLWASLLLAGSGLITLSTRVTGSWWPTSVLAVIGPLALAGFAASLVLLVPWWRHRAAAVGIVLSLVGAGLQVAWLAPRFTDDGARSADPDLTVMTSNLRLGHGDPDAVVKAVRRDRVDVLVLVEVTPKADARLSARGLTELLPYRAGTPAPKDEGLVVRSRWPLSSPVSVPVLHGGLRTMVSAPQPFTLLAVHPGDPLFHFRQWFADLDRVARVAREARGATGDDGLVVAGDFNSTLDQAHFRRLLDRADLHDTAEQAGAGLAPTWPADRLVPLITIDHVLAGSSYRTVSTTRVRVPRSDHLALVARLEHVGG